MHADVVRPFDVYFQIARSEYCVMNSQSRRQVNQRPARQFKPRPENNAEVKTRVFRRVPASIQPATSACLLAGDNAKALAGAAFGLPHRFEVGRIDRIESENIPLKSSGQGHL